MDVAKFASLLTTASLFFACPSQFNDPYEGSLPRSEAQALSEMVQRTADDILSLRPHFTAKSADSLTKFDEIMQTLRQKVGEATITAAQRFGVCCWHMNEYESDAMWRIYAASGQGVAIESTVSRLRNSLGNREDIQIDAIRYLDFDTSPLEKGHGHYFLFQKRKSFEHERELRATVRLTNDGVGTLIACDLEMLVTQIHISPLVGIHVKDAIEAMCQGTARTLCKPVIQSRLLTPPDYSIKISLQ
jgi:hypothetical protein